MSAMVKAEGVHKRFGRLEVLKGIDLEVGRGEVMCMLGPSGSGKSTFLRCINHLEKINAGRLSVDGELVGYRESGGKLHELHENVVARKRAEIGMVFQSFNLFPHMTALENVSLAPVRVLKVSRSEARRRAEDLLANVGLSDKLDVSIALPIVDVRVGMSSNATIYNFEPPPVNHTFADITNNPRETYINQFNAILTNSGSATGIGDLRLRGKYVAWRDAKEKSAVAVGMDLRLPTGDAYKFLGSGTWGIRPFVIYSYSARVSPHASGGFEGNGNSILAGTVTSQPVTKAQLPNVFTYSAGADASIRRWIGLSGDYIGTSLLNAARIENSTFTDYKGINHANVNTFTSTVNQANISLGAKVRPVARLLVTGNVLFRLNDEGLHFKPSPLIGVSYVF